MAPVQRYPRGIPWELHLEAYDKYAERYGTQQSAERLAERGGFGTGELDMFIPGWRERVDPILLLHQELATTKARLAEAERLLKSIYKDDGGYGFLAETTQEQITALLSKP